MLSSCATGQWDACKMSFQRLLTTLCMKCLEGNPKQGLAHKQFLQCNVRFFFQLLQLSWEIRSLQSEAEQQVYSEMLESCNFVYSNWINSLFCVVFTKIRLKNDFFSTKNSFKGRQHWNVVHTWIEQFSQVWTLITTMRRL